MNPITTTRRRFLTSATAVAAGAWIAPRFAMGRSGPPANSRINLACIGDGGRGALNIQGLAGENIVALCDVDDHNAANTFNAYPGAKHFRDFRQMLDTMAKEIDCKEFAFCGRPLKEPLSRTGGREMGVAGK